MIPLYSTAQIRKIDDYAINKLGLPGIVLMENASFCFEEDGKIKFESLNYKI
jgi:NAD(P)H-hydrate repair Nnr-like enzyme with NAD(P)H-hydrate epimerase domain